MPELEVTLFYCLSCYIFSFLPGDCDIKYCFALTKLYVYLFQYLLKIFALSSPIFLPFVAALLYVIFHSMINIFSYLKCEHAFKK